MNPNDPLHWTAEAESLNAQGKLHEALDAIQKALAIDPKCAPALNTYWGIKKAIQAGTIHTPPDPNMSLISGAHAGYHRAVRTCHEAPGLDLRISTIVERLGSGALLMQKHVELA
jgi:hypothetical protein